MRTLEARKTLPILLKWSIVRYVLRAENNRDFKQFYSHGRRCNQHRMWLRPFIALRAEVGHYAKLTILWLSHYANMPMQYTAIFHGCKNGNVSV